MFQPPWLLTLQQRSRWGGRQFKSHEHLQHMAQGGSYIFSLPGSWMSLLMSVLAPALFFFFFFLMGDWSLFTWCISTREDASIQRFSSSVVSQIHLEVAVDLLSKQQLVRGHIIEPAESFFFFQNRNISSETYFNVLQWFPSNLLFKKMNSQWSQWNMWVMERWRLLFTSSGEKNPWSAVRT